MIDVYARLCGANGQDLNGVTSAGVISTDWLDFGSGTGRMLAGGQPLMAQFTVPTSFTSGTANCTVDFQIIMIPKTTLAVLGPFNSTSDVDDATEIITLAGHGLPNGTRVTVAAATGALPTGLAASTSYYIISSTTNTFQLAATPGGTAINLTDAVGTTNVTWYPEIVACAAAVPIQRLVANSSKIELPIGPLMNLPQVPANRYLFARFVPTASLTAGFVRCDIVPGYAQDGRPFNAIGYTTA